MVLYGDLILRFVSLLFGISLLSELFLKKIFVREWA